MCSLAAACIFGVSGAAMPAAASHTAAYQAALPGVYLVVLGDQPLATYDGGLDGYAATAPESGERFDADRPSVAPYRTHLLAEQDRVLAALGDPDRLYSFTTAVNGFAARLSTAQVKQVRSMPDVVAVERNKTAHLQGTPTLGSQPTTRDPRRQGAPSGVWKSVGGPDEAGQGIVVAVIDSGIWPENPSFAGVPLDHDSLATTLPGFSGSCQPGESWTTDSCNAKVVAARHFVKGFGAANVAGAEYLSPRDGSGHGSHAAAIAAGNQGVDVSIGGQEFGRVSGVAPAARLAVYKVCWTAPNPADDGCSTADAVKAIDQAVNDGVDVINYSIGGSSTAFAGVVDRAFLHAAAAGVFVSTAAGDTGSAHSTVAHPSPWVTTVAASRQPSYVGSVTLGNGESYTGTMVSDQPVVAAPVVYAGDVPAVQASDAEAAQCRPGSLDAEAVDEAIVVCDRGVVARLAKSGEVARAGGAAMVLVNQTRLDTEADVHAVPTVHVTNADGDAVMAYLATAGPAATASLTRTQDNDGVSSRIADFSARGPSLASEGDILKPDLSAPGVGILSAVAPPSNLGRLWDLYSGTSMAAPRIAGLAALVAAEHPSWSPAGVKSAMMTTATSLFDKREPLAEGAGEVRPHAVRSGALLDPGLVYDAGYDDWRPLLRDLSPPAPGFDETGLTDVDGTALARPVDATELNQASIAVGSLVGDQAVTRTVTNVSHRAETYTATLTGMRGIEVAVSPSRLTLQPGEARSFEVTFNATSSAAYQRFGSGTLSWQGSRGRHVVASPVVVQPEWLRAPPAIHAVGPNGHVAIEAEAGVTGTLSATAVGLVGADPVPLLLEPGGFDAEAPTPDSSTAVRPLLVPTDDAVVRLSLDAIDDGDDLDLYVYSGARLVAAAVTSSADEELLLTDLSAGWYDVYVNSAASDSGGTTAATMTSWVVPSSASEGFRLAPRKVTVSGGQAFHLGVEWSGLDDSMRWFGYVSYDNSDRRTYVTIN